jgi:16S rRNA (cytosine1402-N4)-methyltransferase
MGGVHMASAFQGRGVAGESRENEQMPLHQPVLLKEVLQYLQPASGGTYVDATLGEGGHSEAILEESSPEGQLLGLDRDPEAIARACRRLDRFGGRVRLIQGSFTEMGAHLDSVSWDRVDGILADLGMSSLQLADGDRGFAFSQEGPLDMRFDPTSEPTAAELINRLSERQLSDLIFRYGEERRARAIARRIVSYRPLTTTTDLKKAIHSVLGSRRRGGIDPATRTFQALRIAVNQEMEALGTLLESACDCLAVGGRLAVVSYHSLEDREVKLAFRERAKSEATRFRVLTAKPVRSTEREIKTNRRARSAKLRVLERMS